MKNNEIFIVRYYDFSEASQPERIANTETTGKRSDFYQRMDLFLSKYNQGLKELAMEIRNSRPSSYANR